MTLKTLKSRHIVKHGLDWICKTRTGFVKHGFVKRGFVKHGFVKHGFVKGGLSFFVKNDCLFVCFCLSLFNLNSFTLYYFHFMLPLHIQIISLKDCLILSNISIWKFLRIIEKYEKHSLTASKYSQHFRHSLVFKNKNSAYLYLTLQCIRRVLFLKLSTFQYTGAGQDRFPTFYGNRSFY